MKKSVFLTFLFITLFNILVNGQNDSLYFMYDLKANKKPWTDKPFYNDPENFQFAIVSDRTGGNRKGIFGDALDKLNQLHPEFVVSLGDLIDGYSKDNELINNQWAEFHGILDTLETKFFYLPGNHDYSNDTMAKQWKLRFSKDYYHFVYKNVLFLMLNSNDGDGVLMGKDQIDYLKQVISNYPNVRWTMIFMHHPLWSYGDLNGFDEIEKALKDRDYSVFAGHTHRYLYEVRNDQNHYVLGTTGGGSKLRGAKFGELDHIGWVTMTNEGPELTNLTLSGILPHNFRTVQDAENSVELIKSSNFNTLVLSKGKERKVILSIRNNSDKTMFFKGELLHHHQITVDDSVFEIQVKPGEYRYITINAKPAGDLEIDKWDPMIMDWELKFENNFIQPEFALNGREAVNLKATKEPKIEITKQNVFLKEHTLAIKHSYDKKDVNIRYTTNGESPKITDKIIDPSFTIKESTTLKMILTDIEGFSSVPMERTFKKVKPFKATTLRKPEKGLKYWCFEGEFQLVPDFQKLSSPKSVGITDFKNLSPDKIGQRLDHYAIQYTGYINVPKTGIYTFYLTSDDGSKLYIDDTLIVDNDGSHDVTLKEGFVALERGFHPIRIDYFEDFLGETLELEYSFEAQEKQSAEFWH